MKNYCGIFVIIMMLNQLCFGQERVDVAEQTIKVGGKEEKVLYYGFAEGDQIVFNFYEVDNKEVKEVEIIEMPENSKFKDYEVKTVRDKIIKVTKKKIYKFRFYNGALLGGRVCKMKIQRIPKRKETIDFNTGVKIVEKFDTTYDIKTETVITGYNIIKKQKTRRVLTKVDTSFAEVLNRTERVHSITSGRSNIQLINFKLPENIYSPHIFKPYRATETVSWVYSIAVGDNGAAWYKDANSKAAGQNAIKLAGVANLVSGGTVALGLFAIQAISAFSKPPNGDNVRFKIYKDSIPMVHTGNSVAAVGRDTDNKQGNYILRLENDNTMDGINVYVNVLAVTVTKTWKDEDYTEEEKEAIKEKKTLKIPKIAKGKVPVFFDE
jgi:hypothetical protein